MECLFAYSYLWAWGFCSMQEYNVYLDRMFSETPDNKILLELEECSNNYKETNPMFILSLNLEKYVINFGICCRDS